MHRANCITKTQPCYRYSRINYSTEYKIYRVQPHRETRRKKAGGREQVSLTHTQTHKETSDKMQKDTQRRKGKWHQEFFWIHQVEKEEFGLEIDATRLLKGQQEKKGFQTSFHGKNVIVSQPWTEQGGFFILFFSMKPCQYGI